MIYLSFLETLSPPALYGIGQMAVCPCQASESELARENPPETPNKTGFYIKLVKSHHQSTKRSFNQACVAVPFYSIRLYLLLIYCPPLFSCPIQDFIL